MRGVLFFIKNQKLFVFVGILIILLNIVSAAFFTQYLKIVFYISYIYVSLIFIIENKNVVYKHKKYDIKSLFLYSSFFYVIQLICIDIIFKITESKLIEYQTLNYAKILPVLLFLLVIINTITTKLR
jgi:hypothetical protein